MKYLAMWLVCTHENVINRLYHGPAHVRAIMHSLTPVHYRIVYAHEHGVTMTHYKVGDISFFAQKIGFHF